VRRFHPFFGTIQYDQVYTNKYGPPLGRIGNGLGDVAAFEPKTGHFIKRMVDQGAFGLDEPEQDEDWYELDEDDLADGLKTLTARQRLVFDLRYGLRDGNVYTQREVADLMGITQQAVNDFEKAAIKNLSKLVKGRPDE